MTPRMIRWMRNGRRCTACGKSRYATREAAQEVIAMASERRREVRAYYSSRCGWWHVTSRQERTAGLPIKAASALALIAVTAVAVTGCGPAPRDPQCPPGQWYVDKPGTGWICATGPAFVFTPGYTFGTASPAGSAP